MSLMMIVSAMRLSSIFWFEPQLFSGMMMGNAFKLTSAGLLD